MPKTLEFPHARIAAVTAKFPEGKLQTLVEISVELTAELAAMLKCSYLFGDGFEHRIGFDFKLEKIRFHMSPHGLDNARVLEFDSPEIASFKVIRNEAGMIVEFKCESQASIVNVLDYVLNVGGVFGTLKLEALQGDLFDGVPVEPPKEKSKPLITKGSKRVQ